jgi:hypothetical protein
MKTAYDRDVKQFIVILIKYYAKTMKTIFVFEIILLRLYSKLRYH